MAVDINEDGYATQSPKEGHDCGIEIDFETLGEEYREVRFIRARVRHP